MANGFPLVGVIAPYYLYRLMIAPALALGVDLRLLGNDLPTIAAKLPGCDVVTVLDCALPISTMRTFESQGVTFRPHTKVSAEITQRFPQTNLPEKGELVIEVLVARSPHSQVSVWAPTESIYKGGVHRISTAPAPQLSQELSCQLQQRALTLMQELEIVGVANFQFELRSANYEIGHVVLGPNSAANWTIDAAVTSQYEQHLRAILDLPMGNPTMTFDHVVSGNFMLGQNRNMYRPYLHLLARSPALKFHQYRDSEATFAGHVTSGGTNLLDLTETIWHALDYLDGVIDE